MLMWNVRRKRSRRSGGQISSNSARSYKAKNRWKESVVFANHPCIVFRRLFVIAYRKYLTRQWHMYTIIIHTVCFSKTKQWCYVDFPFGSTESRCTYEIHASYKATQFQLEIVYLFSWPINFAHVRTTQHDRPSKILSAKFRIEN